MPAIKQVKIRLTCPHCGHQQLEPSTAFSTVCKACHKHLRVQEVLNPRTKPAERAPERRRVTCFDCGTELEVAPSAESTMCKRCSRYVDLKDYRITSAVSKNFKTKGSFVIEPKGYVFNTEAVVGDAIIRGRFLGKLDAQSLTIHSGAEIKGTFTAGRLVIPEMTHFRWPQPLKIRAGEIAGELVANLKVEKTIVVKASGRLFGDVTAGSLVVEAGAVLVGNMRSGK
jgi:cytoskeletal protein CcmA (bactofilin family)/DNA-directed RNA polymerase subunit RPC12/RpoP